MKNENLKKKKNLILSNKSLLSPVREDNALCSITPFRDWEKSYISSKQVLRTEHGIFHYEMYLRGNVTPDSFVSVSRIKVCPKTIEDSEGKVYDFFINPVDKIARCRDIVIEWKDGQFSVTALNPEELNIEEQHNKHLVLLENYIESSFYPEILSVIHRAERGDKHT